MRATSLDVAFPISGAQQFAVDVASALGSDLHHDEDLEILLRRVKIE